MAITRQPSIMRARANSAHQPLPGPRQTWFSRLSLMVRSVCCPSMKGRGSRGSDEATGAGAMDDTLTELRVGVTHARQVCGARPGAELVQQVVAPVVLMPLGDPGLGVVQRAELDGPGGAGLLAGGDDLPVPDGPPLD